MRDHSADHAQPPGEQAPTGIPATRNQQALSSLPIIVRRLPASSSFVLAGALPGAPGSGR
jgi:hypothetical protein